MRRAFTLVELVFVVVIVAVLSVASFKAIEVLIVKSFKAKELTRLSLEAQIALDQISALLERRVPASVIGYDPSNRRYLPIGEIDDAAAYPILEWIESKELLSEDGEYSGFVDMVASNKSTHTLATDVGCKSVEALVFAGSFDRASVSDYSKAFGWHGGESLDVVEVRPVMDGLRIVDSDQPKWIYEKYVLVDGAFAMARGADVDKSAECLKSLGVDDGTLLLFYGYRPWKGETFCADPDTTSSHAGRASVLLRDVGGFYVLEQDYTLRVALDINRSIRGSVPIRFTKMKVVF